MNLFKRNNGSRSAIEENTEEYETRTQIALLESRIQEAKQQATSFFDWFSGEKRKDGLECLRVAQRFCSLNSHRQVELQLQRLQQLTFEDFAERKDITLVPILFDENCGGKADHDNGHFFYFFTPEQRIEAMTYQVAEAPFRIPSSVLEVGEKLKKFPIPGIIEEIEVWDETGGDPILVFHVAGQWYSSLAWERFGPTIIMEK